MSITFTPLYGTDETQPYCCLLQIDQYRILLDCGWDERYDENMLQPLKEVVSDVDAVLLSHPDLAHLGALPYAVGKLGLSAPIYATVAVWRMGLMFLYDALESRVGFGFSVFSADDVDAAFDKMEQTKLKFAQEVQLAAKGESELRVTVTPLAAGHMLGGTVWRLATDVETILYAVDYNHTKERHLNGTVLEALSRPTVLITDAYNALTITQPRKARDDLLLDMVSKTTKAGGCVLLPCDAAGRVLELLEYDLQQGSPSVPLVFFGPEAHSTVDLARGLMEWMSQALIQQFDMNRNAPFSLKMLHCIYNKADLDKLHKPYVVLATNYTLETSPAQDIFMELCSDPRNLVLFTQRAPKHSLAAHIMAMTEPGPITFQRRRNVYLEGEELETFLSQQHLEEEQKALEKEKDLAAEDTDDEDDDHMGGLTLDVDAPVEGGAAGTAAGAGSPASTSPIARRSLRLGFQHTEVKRTVDAYGEVINPADYFWPEVIIAEAVRQDLVRRGGDKWTGAGAGAGSSAGPGPSPRGRAGGSSMDVREDRERKQDKPAHPVKTEPERPKKAIVKDVTVDVRCRIAYVDLEGRSDGKSIKTILSHVQPKKLILIHGSEAGKAELKNYCTKSVPECKEVLIPQTNQSVDITGETNIFKLNLKDSLAQTLDFVKLDNGFEVAFADGEVKIDFSESNLPILQPPPTAVVRGHPAVFVGDVKFAQLKSILNQNGIEAEFYGGILVCSGGSINIRKISNTEIVINGGLCDDYYRVRSLLYSQYKII